MSRPCPNSGGQEHVTRVKLEDHVTRIGGRDIVSQIRHTVCETCHCDWVHDEDWEEAEILSAFKALRSPYFVDGPALRSIRHILGLTRAQLSEVLGLPIQTLSDMEQGHTEVTQQVRLEVDNMVFKSLPQPAAPDSVPLGIPCQVTYSPEALCYVARIQGVDIVSQGQTPEQAASSLADSIVMTLRYLYPSFTQVSMGTRPKEGDPQ